MLTSGHNDMKVKNCVCNTNITYKTYKCGKLRSCFSFTLDLWKPPYTNSAEKTGLKKIIAENKICYNANNGQI
jgi:hypothetical protein